MLHCNAKVNEQRNEDNCEKRGVGSYYSAGVLPSSYSAGVLPSSDECCCLACALCRWRPLW